MIRVSLCPSPTVRSFEMRATPVPNLGRLPVVKAGPLCRRLTLVAALMAGSQATLAQSRPAGGGQAPEGDAAAAARFVESFATRGAALLRDHSLSAEARDKAFRAMLLEGFDTAGGARFVLGRGWRTATPGQRDEFLALFRQDLLRKAKTLFKGYEGEDLAVRRVRRLEPEEFLVETRLSNPDARIGEVDFLVRKEGAGLQIVDVRLEGFSLLNAYRRRFVAPLMQGGVERVLRLLRRPARL